MLIRGSVLCLSDLEYELISIGAKDGDLLLPFDCQERTRDVMDICSRLGSLSD